MSYLKKRQKDILAALKDLGGIATMRQIAEKTGLHVNGVSQSLGALSSHGLAFYQSGEGGNERWKAMDINEVVFKALRALERRGSRRASTTKEIASKIGLSMNAISKVLEYLSELKKVHIVGGDGYNTLWEIINHR